jgi:hypothetical protein
VADAAHAFENPANRHRAVPLSPKQFHYAFTNTLSEEESAQAYERYHVAAPGRFVRDGFLANVEPGQEYEDRSHFTVGQPGWEEVADYALNWCNEHTGRGVLSYGVRSDWS